MTKGVKILLLIGLFFTTISFAFSQKKEPAHLCFYRNDKLLCNSLNFDIALNKIDVFTLRPSFKSNSSLEYWMYSEGRLNVTVKNWMNGWESTIALNIEAGKTYYIKVDCMLSGINISTNEINGKEEWPYVSKKNLASLTEDPKVPLIINETPQSEATVVVKTDTVKKVVYVNEVKTRKYMFEPFADVDQNIPSVSENNELRYALIIGNEDYVSFQPELKTEVNVDYARNDASAFKAYAMKTLGIPEKNIIFILDGTYGQINQAISKINLIAKNTAGKAQLVFYYAGHGMPDEVTKEPYLIPVDISGANVTSAIRLKDVYSKLTEYPSEKVLVFLDACFTGGARGEGLIAGRGITIKPKDTYLKGNILVFTSSSGTQSSLPFHDKKHGFFTYYLLKKLQETSADITTKELSTYLKEKVSLESVLINNKEQNPQINISPDIADKWAKWKLIK